MKWPRTTIRMLTGLALLVGCASGCASVKSLAWNPFTDRIKDRENRFNFAQVTERNGDHMRAERNYRALCEEAPKDARYWQRLGVVLVRDGKMKEGIENLEKARDLDNDNVAILNDLGYAYTVDGEFFEAEAVLRQAMKIDSRDVRTQNNLAMVLGYMGKTDEAYELFRRNNDEGTARNNIAYIHAQSGNIDLAVKEYSKSLNHTPGNKPAAEALVQLNTLHQNLAKDSTTPAKVQLASDQAPAVERRFANPAGSESPPQNQGDRADLVQLLNTVETDASEPDSKSPWGPVNPAAAKGPILNTDDYDWSSAP